MDLATFWTQRTGSQPLSLSAPGRGQRTNGQNPVWTYLLVDPPNLLLSQVHFSGGRANQNAESARLAAKTAYLQGEEMGEQASNPSPRRQGGGVFRG